MSADPAAERRVVIRPSPFNAETAPDALAPAVTPAGRHYVRTNFPVPRLDAGAHRVAVEGAVRHPLHWSLAGLAELPRRELAVTLECAGNHRLSQTPLPVGEPWGGGAVGTAVWAGVSLRDVLARAEPLAAAAEVLVEGADCGRVAAVAEPLRFARALPLERALHPDTLLATEMNGEPLPLEHGAPLRLVVPGWYGMASVKWVARIAVLDAPFAGYFQRDRYVYDRADGAAPEPVQAMRVKSMVTAPAAGEVLERGRVRVGGWAWSGAGPVTRVEVAVDGGDTWEQARVCPAASPYAWQRWEFDWDAGEPGRHSLRVRAADASGAVQPDLPEWNRLGYGANGVCAVVVTVR